MHGQGHGEGKDGRLREGKDEQNFQRFFDNDASKVSSLIVGFNASLLGIYFIMTSSWSIAKTVEGIMKYYYRGASSFVQIQFFKSDQKQILDGRNPSTKSYMDTICMDELSSSPGAKLHLSL